MTRGRAAAAVDAQARWCAERAPALRAHRWHDDTVVYVEASASTHWLAPHIANALRAFEANGLPLNGTDLAKRLALGAEDQAQVEAWLDEMHALGLVRREDEAAR